MMVCREEVLLYITLCLFGWSNAALLTDEDPVSPDIIQDVQQQTFEINNRIKRDLDLTARVGIMGSIDDILAQPYNGPRLTSLDPLLTRNSLRRPQRQSNFRAETPTQSHQRRPPSQGFNHDERNRKQAIDLDRGPFATSFSNTFPANLPRIHRPPRHDNNFQTQNFRPERHSYHSFRHEVPEHIPSRYSSSDHHPEITSFSQPEQFSGHSDDSFSEFHDFFDSKRHRNRRQATIQKETREDENKGFISGKPESFPTFVSIGGFGPLPSLSRQASNFVPAFELHPDIKSIRDKDFQELPSFQTNNRVKRSNSEQESPIDQEYQPSHHIHRTVGRKGVPKLPSLSRVPRQFNPFVPFLPRSHSHRQIHHHQAFNPFQKQNRQGHPAEHGFFPSNNRQPKSASFHGRNHFFPSGPHPPGPLPLAPQLPSGIVGNHQKFPHQGRRGNSATNEAVHRPKFAFASNKFNDFKPVDNSILGSGNFEVIKGGTFYGKDDPHLNHHPYDPFLDGGRYYSGNRPHTNNHVDGFFSNFRDFSEFAARRSDTRDTNTYVDRSDDGPFGPGYASEQIAQHSEPQDMMTSESEITYSANDYTKTEKKQKIKKIQRLKADKKKLSSKKKSLKKSKVKNRFQKISSRKNFKKPKNIQDVLRQLEEEGDPSPESSITEEDPMLALY